MEWTAGDLEDRIRTWITSYNTDKLTSEHIRQLMDEAGDLRARVFDIWFLRAWGSITRDKDNAVWDGEDIPPPLSGDTILTAAEIASGEVPDNPEYLRQLPLPERLVRPKKVYYGAIRNEISLPALLEDEYYATYSLSSAMNSQPEAFTIDGQTFLFGPIPPFDVTINVRGIFKAERLDTQESTNAWTRHAHDLLVYDTQDLLIKYNYEEESRAGIYEKEQRQALHSLLAQSETMLSNMRQSRMQRKG